eukprot:TRINITY_DN7889_c0_g1_i13.p1 TRINITY_DN7889_c0_g1~~TRINITY_DN7889_c0_g1_i13.p1  ORF type:complete len:213 (-),score=44.14 TRINITY_DN7889_c0_g1_i13:11-562(-)
MDIRIHPLVVMCIADHYTREKLQNKKERAYGLLFGQQKGRVVTVYDASDLADLDFKSLELFEKNDLDIYRKIYPDYECVGWYATGDKPREGDRKIHHLITKSVDQEEKEGATDWRSERPMFLLLDPAPKDDRDLPLVVYEEAVHISGDKRSTEFVKSVFRLTSEIGRAVQQECRDRSRMPSSA